MNERGAKAGRPRTAPELAEGDRVILDIQAQARTDQAILAFVDALFADSSFEKPDLQRQALENDNLIGFTLDVIYRPPSADRATAPAPAPAAPPPAPAAAPEGSS